MFKQGVRLSNFKIALYVRCSTEEQGARANPEGTIKNQEQRLRQEIINRNRTSSFGELVAVFVDDGVSAKDTKRPALQRLLRAVEAGEVTMVMATEYSRISRNMRDFASMWELFKSFKCAMVSLRENFDTSTAAGEMMLYNMANLAQFERRLTSERVVLSRLDRAQRGLFNGGVVPLGYKRCDRPGHLEIDNEDSNCIKEAFDSFLKTKSIAAAAKWLNSNNFIPRRMIDGGGRKARVGHFTVSNLHIILSNKVYAGVLEYKKQGEAQEAAASWDPIISKEIFLKVQKLLSENYRKRKTEMKSRYPYTLTGIIYCKVCGDILSGKSAHGKTTKVGYYEHGWATRKNATLVNKALECKMHKRVPAKILEPVVHGEVEKLLLEPELAESIVLEAKKLHAKIYSSDEREKYLRREIASCTNQLESLVDRISKIPFGVPVDEMYKAMQQLGEKRDKAKQELEVEQKTNSVGGEIPVELTDYQEFLRAMKVLWFSEVSSNELKEKIVKKLVAKIEVEKGNLDIKYYAEKNYVRREMGTLVSRPSLEGQRNEVLGGIEVAELPKMSQNLISTCESSNTICNGAQDWTRTSILVTVLPPQGSASTNFATWAYVKNECLSA